MIKEALIFVGGAACGFAAATLILRDRYKTMVDEEVQSVIKWANDKEKGNDQPKTRKETVEKVADLTKDYRSDDGVEEKPEDYIEPYHISAEDYEEDNEYEKVSLDYYLQGEGLYDGEVPVTNVEELVGSDNLVRLHGDVDTVYVRNENTKIDYEIVGIAGRFGVY